MSCEQQQQTYHQRSDPIHMTAFSLSANKRYHLKTLADESALSA
jgi:hypothetical protein